MAKEVKYRDIERFLIASGWQVLRTSASHEIWADPARTARLSIPRHGNKVSPGVVRQIIKTIPNTPTNWQ